MIDRIGSSLPGFKNLRFASGLNVVLAQKSPGASDRQTRNGAGKSSLVDLVHLLLGGNVEAKHPLRSSALAGATYSMSFDLDKDRVEIERAPDAAKKVTLDRAAPTWVRQPSHDPITGRYVLSNDDWKIVLGHEMFGLPDPDEAQRERFSPSFRSLISYFARSQAAGGFHTPQQHYAKQQLYDVQVALSFLLGLDPTVPQALQELRQRESALKVFRKAAKDGVFGEMVDKASDIRTKLAVQDGRIARLREQLATFHVVPQYQEHEQTASRLTQEIAQLANENQSDHDLISQLQQAVRDEAAPRFADVRKAYDEAGLVLPGLVQRRFEEVETFHRSIVDNRRAHLAAELTAAKVRIQERDHRKAELDRLRAQVMTLLQSGGALEHFSRLQGELGRMEAMGEALRKRFEAAETLERKKSDLDVERAAIRRRLQDDHHERKPMIDEAILVFEDLSNELYERAGSLTVSEEQNGPAFEVKIDGSRSKGINNMQIFCFDVMLMELCLRRGHGPGFLIHDSHLFDGVDARQVARALEIGAERAERLGFQYIVTMNEDAVPHGEFSAGFEFSRYVNPVRLTDASDTGGLFGRRFE